MGKGPDAHKTLNGIYTSETTNPYWDNVDGKMGFRLGWSAIELSGIFKSAASCIPDPTSVRMVGSDVPVESSISQIYITPEMVFGLTKDEVFSLCLLKIYNSIEFPKDEINVETGYDMLNAYDIPNGMKRQLFEVLGSLRNLYAILVKFKGDSKYKRFRMGIMKLLFRWMIPGYYSKFANANDGMYDTLKINPSFKREADLRKSGEFSESVIGLPDKERYSKYRDMRDAHGSVGFVLSQLYYHQLPEANDRIIQSRIWADIIWAMDEYDRPDIFGFPGFIFLPENRLTRLFFLFSVICLKSAISPEEGFEFLQLHHFLANIIPPYCKITNDIWKAEEDELWIRSSIFDLKNIHDGYVSSVNRLPEWDMDEHIIDELFRRICGYSDKLDIKRKSLADATPLTSDEIDRLQGGFTEGKPLPMLNFKRVVLLLSNFINDPSPLPYHQKPRYGLALCQSCLKISYIDSNGAKRGCFSSLDADGVPTKRPDGFYDTVLEYECPECNQIRCREIPIDLDLTCPNSVTDMVCGKPTELVGYSFDNRSLKYDVFCESCHKKSNKIREYDNQLSCILFDGKKGKIDEMDIPGPNGERLYKLTSPSDMSIIRLVEHPVNLKVSIDSEETAKSMCPYEKEEIKSAGKKTCCQDMPSSWKKGDVTKQKNLDRGTSGTHKTILVETMEIGGTRISRYVCLDHKERMIGIIKGFEHDASVNPSSISRGKLKLTDIYLPQCKKVKINKSGANIDENRISATIELADVPLAISKVRKISDTDDSLLESMKYPRVLSEPDTPISEESSPPPGMKFITFQVDNKVGIDTRHFFTFDIKEETNPDKDVPCEDLCAKWTKLDFIRSTMPFEQEAIKYHVELEKVQLRKWEISHGPSKLVPTKSMPFIPTVTPREKKVLKFGLSKKRTEGGLILVHIDNSGSTGSDVASIKCPFILTRDECKKCGGSYSWSGSQCVQRLNINEVERRVLISIINQAKTRGDSIMVYPYEDGGSVKFGCIDDKPRKDYERLKEDMMKTKRIKVGGGNDLPGSLRWAREDMKERFPGIKNWTTIMLTDGDIWHFSAPGHVIYSPPAELIPEIQALVDDIGPYYMYQIGGGDVAQDVKKIDKALGERMFKWSYEQISISDAGIQLMKNIGRKLKDD